MYRPLCLIFLSSVRLIRGLGGLKCSNICVKAMDSSSTSASNDLWLFYVVVQFLHYTAKHSSSSSFDDLKADCILYCGLFMSI